MMRKRMKNIVLLALSLAVLGNVVAPMRVSAAANDTPLLKEEGADIVADAIVYESFTASEISEKYFGKEAPEKAGYYFGGWYIEANEKHAIKYQKQVEELKGKSATVYAKFVPSYMLNVKVQNSAKLNERDGKWETNPNINNKTNIRMISAIDSTRYQEVGFHLFVNGNRSWANPSSKYNKTVYSSLKVADSNGNVLHSYTAKDLFGLNSENYNPKMIVANFSNIPENGWKTSIFVRPYWVTWDGIEVRGNGRYIHVEDGIKKYVTVPVNLQGLNNNTTGVVAGTMEVSYDTSRLTFIDSISENADAGYKAGADLKNMAVKEKSTAGTIKCAAIRKTDGKINNINPNQYGAVKRAGVTTSDAYRQSDANTYEAVNNMYVTLRFAQQKATKNTTQNGFLEFNISNISFCDTSETPVSVDVWDVRY